MYRVMSGPAACGPLLVVGALDPLMVDRIVGSLKMTAEYLVPLALGRALVPTLPGASLLSMMGGASLTLLVVVALVSPEPLGAVASSLVVGSRRWWAWW